MSNQVRIKQEDDSKVPKSSAITRVIIHSLTIDIYHPTSKENFY